MVSRGEVALITGTIGLQAGLLTTSLFSVVILITLVTTVVTPLLLKLVYLIPSSRQSQVHLMTDPLPDIVEEMVEHMLPTQEVAPAQKKSRVY